MRPLIIGEQPSHKNGIPLGGAAGRLLGSLVGVEQISSVADTANVFPYPGEWLVYIAQVRVAALLAMQPHSRPLILCGRRVARAAGALFDWYEPGLLGWHPVVVIPHPSGRNRLYNQREHRERAAAAIRSMLDRSMIGQPNLGGI
jgi:uracil-DNA glycosylase